MRRARPAADHRYGPQAAALSGRPLPAALHPARQGHRPRLAQQAARRVVPAVLWVWSSERPHSAASPVRPGAVAQSCCRRVVAEARRPAVLPGAVRSWEPAAASRQPVGAAASQAMASPSEMKAAEEAVAVGPSAQPVASAPQVQRPVEAAGAASDARVRPRAAAEVRLVVSARQPGAAEAGVLAAGAQPPEVAESGEEAVQPPEVAEAVPGAGAVQPRAEAEAARDAVAVLQRAAALPDARGLRPAAERQASDRRPAAGRPSWRRGGRPRPCPARPRVARSAHAMRKSRTALPSRQSWRAAGCEGVS